MATNEEPEERIAIPPPNPPIAVAASTSRDGAGHQLQTPDRPRTQHKPLTPCLPLRPAMGTPSTLPRPRRGRKSSTRKQTVRKASPRIYDTPSPEMTRPDPTKTADEIIELKLDHWRARSHILHTVEQGEANIPLNFGSDPEEAKRGMGLFDGVRYTWWVPYDDASPLPPHKKSVADELARRRDRIQEALDDPDNLAETTEAFRLIAMEAETQCRDQWDPAWFNFNEQLEPKPWKEVAATLTGNAMVEMVARHRMAFRVAPLPALDTDANELTDEEDHGLSDEQLTQVDELLGLD